MAKDAKTVSITFTETKVVQDEHAGTSRETRFEADKSYDLNPRSADRWVKRGVAYFTTDKDAAAAFGASRGAGLSQRDATNAGGEGAGTDMEIDLETLTKTELDKLAEERGVNVVGAKSKADYIEAFRLHEEGNQAFDYDTATDDDLKAEADKRGVDFSSVTTRDEAIAALKAAEQPAE